jgi:hypothetical protein
LDLEDHLDKARQNWSFLQHLEAHTEPGSFVEWKVVVVFYSGLHLIDAYMHVRGEDHGRSHGERNRVLRDMADGDRLSHVVLSDYFHLATRSRAFRYTDAAATVDEYRRRVAGDFRRLEAEVIDRLRFSPLERLAFER